MLNQEQSLSELRNHESYKCNQCKTNFASTYIPMNHMKLYHPKSVTCNSCSEKFEKNSDMKEHLLSDHRNRKKVLLPVRWYELQSWLVSERELIKRQSVI